MERRTSVSLMQQTSVLNLGISKNSSTYSKTSQGDHVFSGVTSVFLTQYIVIILGFFVGHFKLLSKAQTRKLGKFLHRYALSAILFMATLTIQLDTIQWAAIRAILVSRVLMVFVGIFACLSISRGRLLGLAAIISLLLTDTNDIAVIYPTFRILYPLMAYHCCIIVALQILIFKFIACFLLEMNTARERRAVLQKFTKLSSAHMTYRTLFKIFCTILLEPLVMAFAFGLIFNAAFHHKPPIYLTHFFNTFSETFVWCALFYLGLICVNSVTGVPAHGRPLLAIILSIKALVMPILTIKLYHIFAKNSENASVESFTLLYSLSPANANLLTLASRYAVTPDLVGKNISIGTFLFLPCLFIYQCVLYLFYAKISVYAHFLEKTAVFVSWVSLITGLWTRMVFMAGGKTRLMPHRFVICYLDCTLVTAALVVLGSFKDSWIFDPSARVTLTDYVKFSFYLSAYFCTRMWTAFICIGIFIQRRQGTVMPRRNRTVFYIFGLILPIILTVSLKIRSHDIREVDINPFYQNGRMQQGFTIVVLIICLMTASVSLLMLAFTPIGNQSHSSQPSSLRSLTSRRRCTSSLKNGYIPLANGDTTNAETEHLSTETVSLTNHLDDFMALDVEEKPIDNEPMQPPEEKAEVPQDPNNVDGQIHRHFILVGINFIGIFLGICACLWRLLRLEITTNIIILEFMDQTFNFGQGFFVFALYGSDVECMTKPIAQVCSKMVERVTIWFLGIKRPRNQRRNIVAEGSGKPKINPPTRQTANWRIAESFALRHLDMCMAEIGKPVKLEMRTAERAFFFSDFRDWLVNRNLCYNLEEVLSLLLSLELNDYIRGLSVNSVYALDPESCAESVFEFIYPQ
nr:integral membrane protein GPR155 [Hymenolepis microstoma]